MLYEYRGQVAVPLTSQVSPMPPGSPLHSKEPACRYGWFCERLVTSEDNQAIGGGVESRAVI